MEKLKNLSPGKFRHIANMFFWFAFFTNNRYVSFAAAVLWIIYLLFNVKIAKSKTEKAIYLIAAAIMCVLVLVFEVKRRALL